MRSNSSSKLGTRADSNSSGNEEASHEGKSSSKTMMGQISFINTMPVTLPLVKKAVNIECELVFDTPAGLNHRLHRNELQLGAMSSFFFLEHGGFELFDEISISGTGKVGSVLLFSKDELKDLSKKKILVPDSSATSIKLMQVLLKNEFGLDVELVQSACPSESDEFFKDDETIRAQLVIGDKALKMDEQVATGSYLRVDLAQWWFNQFSLPFVFGVWGAKKSWIAHNKAVFDQIGSALRTSRDIGLDEMLNDVISESARITGFSHDRLRCYYLDELDYRLEQSHRQALSLFEQLCIQNGFLSQK